MLEAFIVIIVIIFIFYFGMKIATVNKNQSFCHLALTSPRFCYSSSST